MGVVAREDHAPRKLRDMPPPLLAVTAVGELTIKAGFFGAVWDHQKERKSCVHWCYGCKIFSSNASLILTVQVAAFDGWRFTSAIDQVVPDSSTVAMASIIGTDCFPCMRFPVYRSITHQHASVHEFRQNTGIA